MRPGRSTVCMIIVFSLIMGCFFTTPVSAANETSSVNIPSDTADLQNNGVVGTNVTGAGINTSTSITTDSAIIPDLPENTTGSAFVSDPAVVTPGAISESEKEEDKDFRYISEIPMKKEHQKLLWDYCKTRELDYIDMLALIALESNFNEKCSSGRYKGYFQISSSHGTNLSKTLKTPNKPLDGAVNINWGTAMFSWILADKRVEGLEGKKLRDTALSIYQRGTGGYDRYGINSSYLKKYYKKWSKVAAYFEE